MHEEIDRKNFLPHWMRTQKTFPNWKTTDFFLDEQLFYDENKKMLFLLWIIFCSSEFHIGIFVVRCYFCIKLITRYEHIWVAAVILYRQGQSDNLIKLNPIGCWNLIWFLVSFSSWIVLKRMIEPIHFARMSVTISISSIVSHSQEYKMSTNHNVKIHKQTFCKCEILWRNGV